MRIRQGKTIVITWEILTNGEVVSLVGRDLSLYLNTRTPTKLDFSVEGNVVTSTIEGSMMIPIGGYTLTLWENYGKENQSAVDTCEAFEIVRTSCQEDEEGLEIAKLNLSTSNISVFTDNGQSGGGGGIPEAPIDGKLYGRKDGDWSEVTSLELGETEGTAYEGSKGKANADAIAKLQLNKVDKVEDKGLSTNDYTTEEKNKLAGLSNYDDSELRGLIAEKSDKVKVVDGGSGDVTLEIEPNKFYMFGECTNLTITLKAGVAEVLNEYMFQFTSGETATTLSLPQEVKWIGESNVSANTTYQVSIVNNIAVMGGVS